MTPAEPTPALQVRQARSLRERLLGLLGSTSLPPDEALHITPCRSVHTVGMRYAIDVVFIDRHGRIARIVPALKPWRMAACWRARSTAELGAGGAARHRLRVGDAWPPSAALPLPHPEAARRELPLLHAGEGRGELPLPHAGEGWGEGRGTSVPPPPPTDRPLASTTPHTTQRGAAMAELVVVLPLALLCLLGVMQMALLFHAKSQMNHAAVMAARAGSLAHASEASVREGLARGLVPYLDGGTDAAQLATAYARALGEAALARIEILSPVQQSFADYASPAEARRLRAEENLTTDEPVIPNLNIAGRACPYDRPSCAANPQANASGQSLQDANLLKLRITWGIPAAKQVPLAGPAVVQLLQAQALLDPTLPAANRALIAAGRIPVVSTAIVRMQSEAIRNDLMAQAVAAPQAASAASAPQTAASAASAPQTPASGAGDTGNPGGTGTDPGGGSGFPRPRCQTGDITCDPQCGQTYCCAAANP